MAKKTTAGKSTARRKKPADKVEDAQVVEEDVQNGMSDPSGDQSEASEASSDETAEVTPEEAPAPIETGSEAEIIEAGTDASDTPEDVDEEDQASTDADAETVDADTTEVPDSTDTSEIPAERVPTVTDAGSDSGNSGASTVALIFGGVIAAAIGFFAAYFSGGMNQPPAPDPVDLTPIEQSLEAQESRMSDLETVLAAMDTLDLSGVEAQIATLAEAVEALDARATALENRAPDGSVAPADPGLRDDLEALQDTIAALQAENETAKANARTAAEATLRRAAMTRVMTALDTGAPFADTVAELNTLGVDVPAALSDSATSGVITLAALQEEFPSAARASLAADRDAAAESGETGGLTGFLRSQLGARSLTPQDGDGTDAVLSRAEAALRNGQLGDALAELATLPDVAQPAMAAWIALAEGRAATLSAAQSLSDSLN